MAKNKRRFNRFQRDIDTHTLEENPSFLIVCEGTKTEPNYFKSFEVFSAKVEVVGAGSNTESLVKYAKELADQNNYNQVWCVFDKDDFSEQQFNNACYQANQYGFSCAYSNQSFELWYVLHFCFLDGQLNRTQYISKLQEYLKKEFHKEYKKNDKSIYGLLKEKQASAIKNAKRLANVYNRSDREIPPAKQFPNTYVFKLVEELNKYSRENRWNKVEG